MEKEIQLLNGSLFYQKEDNEIVISGYHGFDTNVVIPEQIEGCPVTTIGKKAFLGQKNIMKVEIPRTITYIEDWAFAHCYFLREITLYPRKVQLGRGVFTECPKLAKANFSELPEHVTELDMQIAEELMQSVSGLLMSTVTVLDAPYLFEPAKAGSTEWLELYDARMMTMLIQDDMEGYTNTISCGEEDYGNTSQETFLSDKRKGKVRLILVRLLNDYGVSDKMRKYCVDYLQKYMPPNEYTESWQVVQSEYAESQECFLLLCDTGCVTENNIDFLIQDLGQDNPERKAFLMKYKQEHFEKADFFAGFEL